jgi:hypothetical protein
MYNLLHGVDNIAPLLLRALGLDQPDGKWPTGRFRDIHLNADGTRIILLTRNGGGNRNHWEGEAEEGPDCRCPGCVIKYVLPEHPMYERDYDDDFDSTYAYVEFKVPEEYATMMAQLATGKVPLSIKELLDATLAEWKAGKKESV